MIAIDDIVAPIGAEFALFKDRLKGAIVSDHRIIGAVARHILRPGGKMLRPILGLLVAKLHGGVNERVLASAMLFELLHHATLIHDDVIDEAYTRRGELTAGALLRSRAGVLAGDFLFAVGLRQAAMAGAFDEITIATRAIENVVEGELRQNENARTMVVDFYEYISVSDLKTGALIAGVATAGAIGAGANEAQCDAMANLGAIIGRAFQIQDDILDYTGTQSGKAMYNDIKERKITLPLILAIEKLGNRGEVLTQMKRGNVKFVVDYVVRGGGIEAAQGVMSGYYNEAIEILSAYSDCDAKLALINLAKYAINRDK